MLLTEDAFQEAAASAVADVEAVSSAELVLVVADRAAGYRDVALWCGIWVGLAAMTFAIYSPWTFAPGWALIEATVLGAVVAWLVHRFPRLLAPLIPRARRADSVRRSALVAFHDEAMTGTRDRTGILYYYAVLEDTLVIIPDSGVLGNLGEAPFHEIEAAFQTSKDPAADRLLTALRAAAGPLEGPLPRKADDTDELDNRPRLHTFAG